MKLDVCVVKLRFEPPHRESFRQPWFGERVAELVDELATGRS